MYLRGSLSLSHKAVPSYICDPDLQSNLAFPTISEKQNLKYMAKLDSQHVFSEFGSKYGRNSLTWLEEKSAGDISCFWNESIHRHTCSGAL